jgi:hypothetical protein
MPESKPKPWHVYFKIGDHHPDDRGTKDGEPVYYQPATGKDCFGQPRYIGPGDRRDFVIVWVMAKEEVIKNIFKRPRKNSIAHRRKRKSYYFLDFEKVFTDIAIKEYRDHQIEVAPIDILNLDDLSDYRIDKKRLDKSFVHGSITEGNEDIGVDGDYANLYLFEQAIAGNIGDGVLVGTVISDNDVGDNDIDFNTNHLTSAIGSITITSDTPGAGMESYVISNTNANYNTIVLGANGNYNFEYLKFDKFRFTHAAANVTRTNILKNVVIDASSSADTSVEWIYYGGNSANQASFHCYDVIMITAASATLNYPIQIDLLNTFANDYNGFVFFENMSIWIDSTYFTSVQAFEFTNPQSGETYSGFNNIVCHNLNTAPAGMVRVTSGATVHLDNPAYSGVNSTQSGASVTQTGKVTSTDGDFTSIDPDNVEFSKISGGSGLYAVGISSVLAENIADILGTPWAPAAPSIGAFSGYVPPPLAFDENPEIYYKNQLAAATITATSEETDFPKENLTLEALWANWQATDTSDQTLTADCGAAVTASRLILSGEFVDLSGVGIAIEYSYNGSTWSTLAFWTQTDAGPVLVRIPEKTARYWRVKLTGLTAAPVIGHWGLYNPLVVPRQLGDGSDYHRAKDLSKTHTTENGKDQMHEGPQMREGRLILGNMIYEDANDTKVNELRDLGETGKMFICLAPDTAPEDVFYALMTKLIYNPVTGMTRSPRVDYREVT